MADQQFIQSHASQFLDVEIPRSVNQVPNEQQRYQFQQRLQEYEEDLQRKLQVSDEKNLNENSSLNLFMEHMERQMISQASTNIRYERLHKDVQADQPQNGLNHMASYAQQQGQIDLSQEFQQRGPHFNGNTQRNFWNQNNGSNNSGFVGDSNQQAIHKKEDFYQQHFSMVNPENPINGIIGGGLAAAPQPEHEKLKDNIELLGGIDDCVGAMEGTLNDFEIKNLNEKYIHYYTFHNKQSQIQKLQLQQAESQQNFNNNNQQQQFQQQNPFLFHPKHLLNQQQQELQAAKTGNELLNRPNQFNNSFEQQQQYIQQQQQGGMGSTSASNFGVQNQSQQQRQQQQQQQQSDPQILNRFKQMRESQQAKLEQWKKLSGY